MLGVASAVVNIHTRTHEPVMSRHVPWVRVARNSDFDINSSSRLLHQNFKTFQVWFFYMIGDHQKGFLLVPYSFKVQLFHFCQQNWQKPFVPQCDYTNTFTYWDEDVLDLSMMPCAGKTTFKHIKYRTSSPVRNRVVPCCPGYFLISTRKDNGTIDQWAHFPTHRIHQPLISTGREIITTQYRLTALLLRYLQDLGHTVLTSILYIKSLKRPESWMLQWIWCNNIAVKTRSDSHARKSLAPVVSEKCPR